MDEYLEELPYPGNAYCPGCPYYSDEKQCCTALDREECAQVNGFI